MQLITWEIESIGGREWNFNEMRMLKLAISAKIINNRDSFESLRFWFNPNHVSLRRSDLPMIPFLRDQKLSA